MAKVLFQSTNPGAFRSTLVGYLHEIAQEHTVMLLADGMDEETKNILKNKDLFPGLEKISFFESPFGGNIVEKNLRMYQVLKKTMQDYKPDIVIAPSDMWPAEMFLFRLAKRAGATTLVLQSGFKIAEQQKLLVWSYRNSCGRMPIFLPFQAKMLLVKIKKYLGYFLYHWILPITVGEMPFFGKTSFVFWNESAGLRDAEYSAVFSKRDYDIGIKDGVALEKLFTIGHPLEHEGARIFFEQTYFSRRKGKEIPNTITIMWPEEKTGFKQQDQAIIPREQMQERRVWIIRLLIEKLPGWKIYIKPHPSEKEAPRIKEFLGRISSDISVADPGEPADIYIEKSMVVAGMSLPSTTLFTASKQHPDKIILSLNLDKEFLGDSYKEFEGIEYIDTEEKFIRILDAIREGRYEKKESSSSAFDFSDAAELINHIYAKRLS